MGLNWMDYGAIAVAVVVAVVAFWFSIRFRLYEFEEGRIGDEPIIKYNYFLVIFLAVGGGIATYFGVGYALRALFGP